MRPNVRHRACPLVLLALLTLLAPDAHAQFLYLDSNGDGFNGPEDLLNAAGPRAVDVWLQTDRNRDGSEARLWLLYQDPPCLLQYAFVLHAVAGTVLYESYVDRAGFATIIETASNDADFYVARAGDDALPPGRHLLGTLYITVLSGSPVIEVAPSSTIAPGAATRFRTGCGGNSYFLQLLSYDGWWSDADGLTGVAGGPRAPLLAPVHDMTVNQGESAEQVVRATDSDGDTPTLFLSFGPSFVTCSTTASGEGWAEAILRVEPGAARVGPSGARIRADDGIRWDEAVIQIVVGTPGFAVDPLPDLTVLQHVERFEALTTTHPVGYPSPHVLYGPAYASVFEGRSLLLSPSARSDVGVDTVVIAYSAYYQTLRDTVAVTVLPNPLPPILRLTADPMITGLEGRVVLQVSDPDSDPITAISFDRSGLPEEDAALLESAGGYRWAILHWIPTLPGTYALRFAATDSSGATGTSEIDVTVIGASPSGLPPQVRPGGPYEGAYGVPLLLDGRDTTDPDHDPLTFVWDLGDGGIEFDSIVSHVYADVGAYTVTLYVSDGLNLAHASTIAAIGATANARAHPLWGTETIRLAAPRLEYCFAVQAPPGSFDASSIIGGSVRLVADDGSGEVPETPSSTAPLGDATGDGVPDRRICFARDAVRDLLDHAIPGRGARSFRIEGALAGGADFQAPVVLQVEIPGSVDLSIAPNPLNPTGTLTIHTSRLGFATVSIYDVRGRRVRLLQQGFLASGYHDFPLDGRNDRGRPLPSGVYFCRVETPDGSASRTFTFLK